MCILWNNYHSQVNQHIHHLSYLFLFFVVRILVVYSFSSFQVPTVLLTVVTVLYVKFPRAYSSYQWRLLPFDQHRCISPRPWWPPFYSLFLFSFFRFFFPFIFISWRLITLQYCSCFCHTLTWISQVFTCVPHPDPPSRLPPHPIPLGLPSAPAPSTCLMHPTWAGDLFHPW